MGLRMRLLCRFVSVIGLLATGAAWACMTDGPGFSGVQVTGARTGRTESGELKRLRACKATRPADRQAAVDAWFQERSRGAAPGEQARLIEEHDALRDLLNARYNDAIRKLLALEGVDPGRSGVAGALGTAYEHIGDYESAIRWINTAMAREPQARRGSEWLHVRILQARHALRTDPAHLAQNPVVPLTKTGLPLDGPAYPPSNRPLQRDELRDALYIQLGEQVLFLKPEEPLIAHLFQNLQQLEEATGNEVAAGACRALAREYSLNSEEALKAIPPYTSDRFDTRPLAWGILIVIVAAGIFIRYRTS